MHNILKVFFVPLLCSLVLQGCGSSSSSEDDPTPAPQPEQTNWKQVAEQATQALVTHFWNGREGYFNSMPDVADTQQNQYWPQAHAMDVVIDAYLRTGSAGYRDLFDKWHEGIKKKAGNSYFNDFYDDEEWICLTMLRLYDCTKEQKYLDTAQLLWDDIQNAWNTKYCGGGMAWRKSQPWSKNACSNGPAGIIAARMYNILHKASDLDLAKRIYNWERDNLYAPGTGAVYDSMNGQDGNSVTTWVFTYNQGTFVGMCYELFKITGETLYLRDAVRASSYTLSSLSDLTESVLKDEGTGDGGLFKGIFVRYFTLLIQEPQLDASYKTRFVAYLKHNAEVLKEKGLQAQYLIGSNWARNTSAIDLGTHVSGCVLLEAVALDTL